MKEVQLTCEDGKVFVKGCPKITLPGKYDKPKHNEPFNSTCITIINECSSEFYVYAACDDCFANSSRSRNSKTCDDDFCDCDKDKYLISGNYTVEFVKRGRTWYTTSSTRSET